MLNTLFNLRVYKLQASSSLRGRSFQPLWFSKPGSASHELMFLVSQSGQKWGDQNLSSQEWSHIQAQVFSCAQAAKVNGKRRRNLDASYPDVCFSSRAGLFAVVLLGVDALEGECSVSLDDPHCF